MGGKVLLRNQRDHPVRKESYRHLTKGKEKITAISRKENSEETETPTGRI